MKELILNNGIKAKVGMEVTDFRNEKYILHSWSEPHTPNSTGRVYVKSLKNNQISEYFPSVINAKFIESKGV